MPEPIVLIDSRKVPFQQGDTVCYPSKGKVQINKFTGVCTFFPGKIEVSKVTNIEIEGPGFAEIGPFVTITLEDGHVMKGDTENGGWLCYKLPEVPQ